MLKEKLRAQILGGSLQDYKNHLSGLYKGFYITIDVLQAQYLVKISMNPANDTDMAALNSFLNNQKLNQKKLVNVATGSHSIMLTIKMPSLAKNIPEVVNGIVDPVIDYLISYTVQNVAQTCHRLTVMKSTADTTFFVMHAKIKSMPPFRPASRRRNLRKAA